MFWLDRSTLLVGRGYRTNDAGIDRLRALLGPSVDMHVFDLPHLRGPNECLHLMSLVSPLDTDLAVAYLPPAPVRSRTVSSSSSSSVSERTQTR